MHLSNIQEKTYMGAPIKLLLEKKIQPLDDKVNSTFFFLMYLPSKNSKQFFLEEMYSSLLKRTSCPNNNLRFETREG